MYTYLDVQQGIGNILELFKCLDDRPQAQNSAPPASALLSSPLAIASSPVLVTHSLEEMVHFCVHVARGNPGGGVPMVFTTEQVDKLRKFVSDHLEPGFHKRQSKLLSSIESSLGVSPVGKADPPPVVAQGILGTLLKVKRRRSSMEDVVDRKPSLNQSSKSGDEKARALATGRILIETRGLRSGAQQSSSISINDEMDDTDALVSSESDSEDVRREIKRGEKDTLQQVEALLRTVDAKQSMSSSSELQSAAVKLKHRRSAAGRHGGLHNPLLPVSEGAGVGTLSDVHEATMALDKNARLDAVHAFFREKRRRERQEHQQQREVLALLTEASYNTSTISSNSHGDATGKGNSSTPAGGPGSKTGGPIHSRVVASMMTRKRSNGVATLALNSVVQQQQQQAQAQSSASQTSTTSQQEQQARASAAVPRKPMRPPKTVR